MNRTVRVYCWRCNKHSAIEAGSYCNPCPECGSYTRKYETATDKAINEGILNAASLSQRNHRMYQLRALRR